MRRLLDNDSGQLILIACVFVVFSLLLIATYEYSALGTGEMSINRENMNAYYFYDSFRERYNQTYNNYTYIDRIPVFEKQLKEFALLHGYSVDFVCSDKNRTIVFVDKDIKIREELNGGLCP